MSGRYQRPHAPLFGIRCELPGSGTLTDEQGPYELGPYEQGRTSRGRTSRGRTSRAGERSREEHRRKGFGTATTSAWTILGMQSRRTRAYRLVAVLVSVGVLTTGLSVPTHAGGREPLRSIKATGMFPAFSTAVTDYALRDCAGKEVVFDLRRENGAQVSVNGRKTTASKVHLRLRTDQLVTVKASLGSVSRTWFVRCLPKDFPELSLTRHRGQTDGFYLLTAGWRPYPERWVLNSPYYVILDGHGVPVWYMRAKGSPTILDRSPAGNLYSIAMPVGLSPSYGGRDGNAVVETTLAGDVLRTITTAAGDPIDVHTLQVLPNGNLLVLTMPIRRGVDLSAHFRQLVPLDVGGGGVAGCDVTNVKAAAVAYPSVRELTTDGSVVWSWDGWEHLSPSESALPALSDIDMSEGVDCVVDLFHGNSVTQSPDGSTVLVTARFASATYGIDKVSGAVSWKVGGVPTEKSLQVIGDPYGERGPAGHHGGSIDAEGNLLVFDNRRVRSETARAVIYRIDTSARTATYARGFEPVSRPCEMDGPVRICFALSMGNAQHLHDGGVLVSWGFRPGSPNVATRFDGSGRPVMSLTNAKEGQVTYHVTHVVNGSFDKSRLRATASSTKRINPAWDAGLTWQDAPSDAAGSALR
jgi:hypothetical protein